MKSRSLLCALLLLLTSCASLFQPINDHKEGPLEIDLGDPGETVTVKVTEAWVDAGAGKVKYRRAADGKVETYKGTFAIFKTSWKVE